MRSVRSVRHGGVNTHGTILNVRRKNGISARTFRMHQPSLVLKAVRAAEAGSDVGGDTVMVPADVTSSNMLDLWRSSVLANIMNSPLKPGIRALEAQCVWRSTPPSRTVGGPTKLIRLARRLQHRGWGAGCCRA